MSADAVTAFAAVGFGLLAAHAVADHWVQTSHQAANKGLPGSPGRLACARHVASYTAVTAGVVALLWLVLGLHLSPWGYVAGQVISAGSHYWADRRFTLQRLADRLGKGEFYRLGAPREVSAWTEPISACEYVVALETRGDDPPGWDNPSLGTGAYALDQAWHHGWLFITALATVVL